MDDKTCDLVMSELLKLSNNNPGVTLSISTTYFGDFFPGLSTNQVLATLKLLSDQEFIQASCLERDVVQVRVPVAAFGYFDAKKATEGKRFKQKLEDRGWDVVKILLSFALGYFFGKS